MTQNISTSGETRLSVEHLEYKVGSLQAKVENLTLEVQKLTITVAVSQAQQRMTLWLVGGLGGVLGGILGGVAVAIITRLRG